jgi:predicted DNA-binding transcriptional regulator YafY
VDRLRELGYPVSAQPGVDGGYQLASGAALPPLVLDDDEAVAVAAALRLATAGAGTEAAARTLAKLSQVMPARLRRRAEAVTAMTESASWNPARAGQTDTIDPDVLAVTALACRDSERIRFGYVAASGERTERHAEPHRLVVLDRRWYLVAYDLNRNDWRSFRLDRVAGAPQPTGARFRARALPADDAADFVRKNITAADGASAAVSPVEVVAVVQAPAAAVRQRIGRWATVTAEGPGRCRLVMTTPETDWVVIALGLTGAEFRIASPPEMAEKVAAWGARFARAGAPPDGPGE